MIDLTVLSATQSICAALDSGIISEYYNLKFVEGNFRAGGTQSG
jgi:hypothetical protein